MALALIASILAFSYYSNVGRDFTLLEGHGLDLVCNDRKILKVDKCVVLREFPCDVKTACVVNNGPCKALNLFIRRGAWKASVSLLNAKDDLHLISP